MEEEKNQEVISNVDNNENSNRSENTKNETTNGYAVASLVLGCIGLVGWLLPIIGYIVGILAIVFGCISKKSRKNSMSTIGIVMAVVTLILSATNSILGVLMTLGQISLY